jgi:putative phosphoribosyl transferase
MVANTTIMSDARRANFEQDVLVPVPGGAELGGNLSIPAEAYGVVLFAHGSGSSRFSPRNQYVSNVLRKAGIGTVLIDLLTREEDSVYENRFDISALAGRLAGIIGWLKAHPRAKDLKVGLFGASTGAAALQVAAMLPGDVACVVSRGGRPDLAGRESLRHVTVPTLLIVGARDDVVLELNRDAYAILTCKKRLHVVPRATHLFEEPGTLEEAADVAKSWFEKHLR